MQHQQVKPMRTDAADALILIAGAAVLVACAIFLWSIIGAQRGLSVLCVP